MSDQYDMRRDLCYLTRLALLACIAEAGFAIEIDGDTYLYTDGPCPERLTREEFGITLGKCTLIAMGSSDDDDDADEEMFCSTHIEAVYHLRSPAASGAESINFGVRLRPKCDIVDGTAHSAEIYTADVDDVGETDIHVDAISEQDRQQIFDDVRERVVLLKMTNS